MIYMFHSVIELFNLLKKLNVWIGFILPPHNVAVHKVLRSYITLGVCHNGIETLFSVDFSNTMKSL